MEKSVKEYMQSSSKASENLAFLRSWANANEDTFTRCMDILAEEDPKRFAEIYVKVKSLTQPKETNTNVNVSIENKNSAIEKLATLASVTDSMHRIEAPGRRTRYAEYQEIK